MSHDQDERSDFFKPRYTRDVMETMARYMNQYSERVSPVSDEDYSRIAEQARDMESRTIRDLQVVHDKYMDKLGRLWSIPRVSRRRRAWLWFADWMLAAWDAIRLLPLRKR